MGYSSCIKSLFGFPRELLEMVPISQEQKVLMAQQARMFVEMVNEELSKFEAFQIVVLSIMSVLIVQYGFKITMWLKENLTIENVKTQGFRLSAKLIPQVKAHIEKEMAKMEVDCVKKYSDIRRDVALTKLPNEGKS